MKKTSTSRSYKTRLTQLSVVTLSSILLAMVATGCHKEKSETASGPRDIDVAVAAEDSIVVHQTFPGTVSASDVADAVGRVNGKLLSINFKSGDRVSAGQVLFTIESTSYRDAVARAEASLATAKSSYEYARQQYAAMKKALEADAVSRMEVVQAESNMLSAQASIKDAEAALNTARLNLSYCTVTAPISGIVTSNTMDVGNYVNGEGNPVRLTTVYNNSKLVAKFSLSETQYEQLVAANGGIAAGIYRNVPLTFRQATSKPYTVNLTYEAPTVDASTGTMLLQGVIDNSEQELRDGMYVTFSLPTGVRPHAVLVKDASIGSDQLGSYMYLVNDSNKVVYTPVVTGELYQDSLRVIEKGVRPGDRYVSKALLTVRAGEKINPVSSTGQAGRNKKK
ncbi:MAG: efflux RND transporter periplasmic adaptor subunit [Bacteroidales bacterium]|nr:efflux RND transporter periplasmic adaptor subunit [Bacteroidales bacterium]